MELVSGEIGLEVEDMRQVRVVSGRGGSTEPHPRAIVSLDFRLDRDAGELWQST